MITTSNTVVGNNIGGGTAQNHSGARKLGELVSHISILVARGTIDLFVCPLVLLVEALHEGGDFFRLGVEVDEADGFGATLTREGSYGLPHHRIEWRIPLSGLGDAHHVTVDGVTIDSSEADPDADTTTFEDGPWRVVRTRTDVTRVEVR